MDGRTLPALEIGPVERETLARFARASRDPNPIHLDPDAARAAGLDDVIAHGMLVLAWLGRALDGWFAPARRRELRGRFTGITRPGERIRCEGRVVEALERDGERLWRVELRAIGDDGSVKIEGRALVTRD